MTDSTFLISNQAVVDARKDVCYYQLKDMPAQGESTTELSASVLVPG